ncbi:hypothetical protein [Streptomyces sp. NPDC002533]
MNTTPVPDARALRSAAENFAAAVEPAGEVASALGSVAHQLSFLERTERLRDQPDAMGARESATLVIGDALGLADASLQDASYSLYAAAAAPGSPPPKQLRAARSRTARGL